MDSRPDEAEERHRAQDEGDAPEDQPGEPGAQGGSKSPAADKPPAAPSKEDDSAVGDTDQHSGA